VINMKIEYSFVVPTYNSEKTIEKCLESIKEQGLKNSEIIVVDDCSKDKTLLKIRKYADVIIVKEKRSGPAKSRNLGWKISKGRIVIFVDSDVYLPKGFIRKLLPLLKKYDGIISDPSRNDSYDVSFENWAEPANFLMIKKEALKRIGGYSEIFPYAMGEDSDLLIRLLKSGYKIRNQKMKYIHDVSHKPRLNFLKIFFKGYLWVFVCNLKNFDVHRCRKLILVKIPLKLFCLFKKYKKLEQMRQALNRLKEKSFYETNL